MAKSIQLISSGLLDKLEDYIESNGILPDTRLPSERELCVLWQCNRVTLRTVIRKLIDEGRLYSLQGSGTYLAAPKIERNLWQFCSFKDAMAAGGHTLITRLISLTRTETPKKLSEALKLSLGTPLWRLERLRIVNGNPLSLETSWIPVEKARTLDHFDFEQNSLYETLESHFGIRLVRCFQDISIETCTLAESVLLEVAEGTDLMVLGGTAFDGKEQPIEYSRALTRGDRCRFTVQLGKEVMTA